MRYSQGLLVSIGGLTALIILLFSSSVPGTVAESRGASGKKLILPVIDESHKYKVINTGIPATGNNICWYDNTRLVFLKVRYSSGMSNKQVDGLYYLDVGKPHEIKQVDLAPLERSIHKDISGIRCQEDVIWFYTPSSRPGITRLYTVRIGESAELVSEMRGASGSLRGRYVIGGSRRFIRESGPLHGVFEGHDDCAVSYIKPGFKVLCWDLWNAKRWAFPEFVFAEYKWQDSIKIRGEDGKPRNIPNPDPRVYGKDGKPLLYGLFARSLENELLFRVDEDESFFPSVSHGFVLNPQNTYSYAPCRLKEQAVRSMDGVCRYQLDGAEHQWEEVFRFQLPRILKASIRELSVDSYGNVLFTIGGARSPYLGIWNFTARRNMVIHVTQPGLFLDEAPHSAPDGKWIAFYRTNKEAIEIALTTGEAR